MMPLFDLHSHRENGSSNVVIHNQFPFSAKTNAFFSIGIHPWYFSEEDWQMQWEIVEQIAQEECCVAIGECGLDRNIDLPLSLQQLVFERHILLSEALKKPLVIHCVKAFSELIALKKKYKPQQMWILHGFNKKQSIAKTLLDENIKLSFGQALLTNKTVQEVFKSLPEGSYFLETDDSEIPIEEIYQKAKELRNTLEIRFDNPQIKIIL